LCARHPAAAGQSFLVSDGEDLSTPALIHALARAMDRRALLLPVPAALLHAGAMLAGRQSAWQRLSSSLQVDISKARTLLGWQPPCSVAEGLQRCVTAYLHP
jgi:nucleoside-diphosphate-sugar epimerase